MKILIFLLFSSLYCHPSFASWKDPKEYEFWEKKVLGELKELGPISKDKEFMLFMIAGRELSAYGLKDKSKKYYLKAYEVEGTQDKTEAVIQLISLNLEDKSELKKSIARSREWFQKNPGKLTQEMDTWIKMIDGYSKGETPIVGHPSFSTWATDARVDELISEGKTEEALSILGPRKIENANINVKVRQDILNISVLGKKSPPLWCEKTLDKYPTSMTWTMRVCRYLRDWKTGKKSTESIKTISDQMELEKTPHKSWIKVLEKI